MVKFLHSGMERLLVEKHFSVCSDFIALITVNYDHFFTI